jgi:hypothetical protein
MGSFGKLRIARRTKKAVVKTEVKAEVKA